MLDAFSLKGDVALITGGGTGLGFAIASAFIEAGAQVAITGRRESVLKDAANTLGPSACRLFTTSHRKTPARLFSKCKNISAP